MFTEVIDGGRRFFKCPRVWVLAITFHLLNMFLEYPYNSHDILIVVFLPSPKKTMGSLGGSILDQFIRISSTSTTCRTKSLIYKGKLAAGIRKTKTTTTTTMVQVHRRHSAMIYIAPALITRQGPSAVTPATTTTNNGRLLWRRCNTICYVATLLGRRYLIHMAHLCVCCLV